MDFCLLGFGKRRLSTAGQSLYQELEVTKFATEREINLSYRKLALRYHPDKNPNNQLAVEKFKEINRAHKILIDVKRKQIYDEYGSRGLFLADKYGEEEVPFYSILFSTWFQVVGLVTCCFFCCFCCCVCCCNGFCGLCCKDEKNNEEEELVPNVEDLQNSIEGTSDGRPSVIQLGGPNIITSQPHSEASSHF